MLTNNEKQLILDSFSKKELSVKSVSPEGDVEWKEITHVFKNNVAPKHIFKIKTQKGEMILTEGHKVFLSPSEKKCAANLGPGNKVLSIEEKNPSYVEILSVERIEDRTHMYDLTVKDYHNFLLESSKAVVSNSPDRNYRFRPPEHEGDVKSYNEIFGYVWEDEELLTYIQCALDWWNMMPPETENLCTIELLVRNKPTWKTAILWGAIVHAATALAFNWTQEQFSYSIGGISLDIQKASNYESLKQNAEGQLEKATEAKSRTTKYIRGLKQPRWGIGVRSSWGPKVSSGVLSPRNFVGL